MQRPKFPQEIVYNKHFYIHNFLMGQGGPIVNTIRGTKFIGGYPTYNMLALYQDTAENMSSLVFLLGSRGHISPIEFWCGRSNRAHIFGSVQYYISRFCRKPQALIHRVIFELRSR